MTTKKEQLEQLPMPPARILLHPRPGKATEEDLLETPRLCELIDGVLVEKAMGFYESRLAVVWEHFPNGLLPQGQILDLVPDLAVEILSPTNTKKEMERKRREYFAGGAKLVWEVYPKKKLVKAYSGPKKVTTIRENGTLDGSPVLPGFTLSVKKRFERAGNRQ